MSDPVPILPAGSAAESATPLEALARAARSGDVAAFEAIVRRTQAGLLAFVRLALACPADAEEVAQEAYLRAWCHLHRYDPRLGFRPWLFTIARRLAIGRLRRRRAPVALPSDDAPSAQDADPAGRLDETEQRAGLWRRARALVGAEATSALWLRYAEDLSAAEIGRILGKREGAVRAILHRARERLAHHLDPGRSAPRVAGRSTSTPCRL